MVADSDTLKSATKTVLHDIIKHANGLATGLQNAAPAQLSGPGNSILYLNEIAKQLLILSRTLDDSSASHEE